jgi:hypothetical protein
MRGCERHKALKMSSNIKLNQQSILQNYIGFVKDGA